MTGIYMNSFGTKTELSPGIYYHALSKLGADVSSLPFSLKILLESALRNEDGKTVIRDDVLKLVSYNPENPVSADIAFNPARVLMQDFTGVPAVVDLAALRSAVQRMGGDPQRINPVIPVDLVIDHSVQVDYFGTVEALARNSQIEFERNRERYEFLHWGQNAFDNFTVVPPSSGICHQVNLEYLGKVVLTRDFGGDTYAFPDSLVGTDSHTTMINGLGIVGWGVGGIEAEAVMLGQPISMLTPEVIGFKLTGSMKPGITATDLVLTITQILRKKGVVGKFVEFYGSGLSNMSVPDRATISNMAPEYGATMGYFPVDDQTLEYLRYTGRPDELIVLVEKYFKLQDMFRTDDTPAPVFTDSVELDLSSVEPSIAGPKRPQDRTTLSKLPRAFKDSLYDPPSEQGFGLEPGISLGQGSYEYAGGTRILEHGDVVIAAITSCTNTSNPSVMIGAGLVAKKAVERGLTVKPHVKTSLAPGSKIVTHYLSKSGLLPYLEEIGFNIVGYGCTTCIGNSGPLPEPIAKTIEDHSLIAASVLSGNRNFTGRINPHTKASFLTSPPLVVAFALAGKVTVDLEQEPVGFNDDGEGVYLRDIWPTTEEIAQYLKYAQEPDAFHREYDGIVDSNQDWNSIKGSREAVYNWDEDSSYIQEPPFFIGMPEKAVAIAPIEQARVLVKAGNSITTDHISPAGAIHPDSAAGQYLTGLGIEFKDFNSYGSRRGNDRVMTRGTFANVTFLNHLGGGKEGGWTTYFPGGEQTTIFDAAQKYIEAGTPTIVLAGYDYGMGSSRDWAAKGTFLLGIKAVIAESFERIHRSNLIGMGVLPLQFNDGDSCESLGLTGKETFTIHIDDSLKPGQLVEIDVVDNNGTIKVINAICRIDSEVEVDYYRNGGILHAALRGMRRIHH